MIAIVLLLGAAAVLGAAMRWLPDSGWVYRSPRLGIAAWYAAFTTAAVAVGAAFVESFVPWPAAGAVCTAVIWCSEAMSPGHPPLAWIAARVLAGGVVLAGGLAALRVLRSTRTVVGARRRHRDLVRLAGRRSAGLDATVIDHPQPAAFVVSRRSCGVVVTSGALHQLSDTELAAVLAHERAHAAGYHQVLLDVTRIVALTVPRLRVAGVAREQIARLVEMRADEVAARRHPRRELASALVAMSTGHPGGSIAPGGVPAATGGDTAERLHRLMRPPRRLPAGVSSVLWTALAVLPAAPLAVAATCRWWPMLAVCPWGR
jgi:Zn-dependent protease with chaperone function